MTKLFTIIAVAFIATSVVSCGPSAEEKAKMEERANFMRDSIATELTNSLEQSMNEVTPDTTAAPVTTETAPEAHTGH